MWDAKWQPVQHFRSELRLFFAAAAAAYPDERTLLVVRTANAGCCAREADPELDDRATGGRIALLNAEIVLAAREALPPARMRLWDVYALGDARSPATAAALREGCRAPHEPAQDVAIEDEILLNGLCAEWGAL